MKMKRSISMNEVGVVDTPTLKVPRWFKRTAEIAFWALIFCLALLAFAAHAHHQAEAQGRTHCKG